MLSAELRRCLSCWRSFVFVVSMLVKWSPDWFSHCLYAGKWQSVDHASNNLYYLKYHRCNWLNFFLCMTLMVKLLIMMDEIKDLVGPYVWYCIIFYVYFQRGLLLISHWTLMCLKCNLKLNVVVQLFFRKWGMWKKLWKKIMQKGRKIETKEDEELIRNAKEDGGSSIGAKLNFIILLCNQVLCVTVPSLLLFWLTILTLKAPSRKYIVCNTSTFAFVQLSINWMVCFWEVWCYYRAAFLGQKKIQTFLMAILMCYIFFFILFIFSISNPIILFLWFIFFCSFCRVPLLLKNHWTMSFEF